MKLRIVSKSWLGRVIGKMGYAAMAFGLWCFVAPGEKSSERLLNHENIHLYQQVEMLFIFQWLWYIIEYLIRRLQYSTHDAAYHNMAFEREAYANESNLSYLITRKPWAWLNYLRK